MIKQSPPQLHQTFEHQFSFTKEQLLTYAQISGDVNPIHVSEAYGNESIFGKCIVHGYFTTSIFSKVYGTILYADGNILVSQSAKYIRPIYTDVKYKAVFTVIQLHPDKNRVTYLNEIFEVATGELKVTGEATLMNKLQYNWE